MAKVTGTFGATGAGQGIPGNKEGSMGVSLRGTWVGTILLEWSFDGGANYSTIDTYTTNEQIIAACPSDNILYRLRCSAYTSGTATYGYAN